MALKFIVNSTALLRNLQALSGVISSNVALPILDDFLFQIKKNELIVTGSDLETTITTRMEAQAKEEGSVAVSARILLDTLKTFPSVSLTFSVNEKNFQVEINSDYGKYKLSGHNPEDFPRIPAVDRTTNLELPCKVLLEAINKTLFATGNDELRPVMSGVYCQIGADNVTFVATDAHRLVRYRRTDARAGSAASFIMPKKPLQILKNILPDEDTKVKIEYNESNAFFTFGEFSLICRLIDGRYPNYESVIPADNPNKLTIDRESLLNSIRRVSIYSNKTTHQVKLKITGSELQISAEDLDFSNEANERLSCTYTGEDMEIAFNARFMTDMLSNISTEEVMLEMSQPNRAGLISPPKEQKGSNEDLLMLVMPVMLN